MSSLPTTTVLRALCHRAFVRYELRTDGTIHLTAPTRAHDFLPTMPCFDRVGAPCSIDRLTFMASAPPAYADRLSPEQPWACGPTKGWPPTRYRRRRLPPRHPLCEVTDDDGHGLRAQARGDLGTGPTLRAHENARHWWELPELPSQRPVTHLRLLTAQMGAGGDDSWVRRCMTSTRLMATEKQVLT